MSPSHPKEFSKGYVGFYDPALRRLFADTPAEGRSPARRFLTGHRRLLVDTVADWARVPKYAADGLVRRLAHRAGELGLHLRTTNAAAMLPVGVCLASLVVEALSLQADVIRTMTSLREKTPDVVFNLTEHFGGDRRKDACVAAMLDLLGLVSTGASTAGLMLCRDKAVCKRILGYHRIRQPSFHEVPIGRARPAGRHCLPAIDRADCPTRGPAPRLTRGRSAQARRAPGRPVGPAALGIRRRAPTSAMHPCTSRGWGVARRWTFGYADWR